MTSANMQTLQTLLGGGNTEFNKNRTSGAFEQWLREFYDPDVEVHEVEFFPQDAKAMAESLELND